MVDLDQLRWMASWTQVAFVFAFGAIVGSFLNVVAYRLPQGKNLVLPPSACPHCETKLRWFDNMPILGWLALRGKCRYCKSPISIQYPLVELVVALLFAGTFALWICDPSPWELVGVDTGWWRPGWADESIWRTWPMMTLVFAMFGGLVAITLIDAKTFTIPLIIPWIVTGLAALVHTGYGVWGATWWDGEGRWTLWLATGSGVGLAFGGAAGVALSILLLRWRIIPQSYADYEEWEKEVESKLGRSADVRDEPGHEAPSGDGRKAMRTMLAFGPAVATTWVGMFLGKNVFQQPLIGLLAGLFVGLLIGRVLSRLVPKSHAAEAAEEPIWLQYPHTRREMIKELVFLTPIVGLAILGAWLTGAGGPWDAAEAPLWVQSLGGAALGYLVGGAVVWSIRLMGSLAIGKEAMGLGDVHLMAMVGAVMGWPDAFIAFFVAPFLAISWTIGALLLSRTGHGHGTALPFGPHLAAATVLVALGKPVIEFAAGTLMGAMIDLP